LLHLRREGLVRPLDGVVEPPHILGNSLLRAPNVILLGWNHESDCAGGSISEESVVVETQPGSLPSQTILGDDLEGASLLDSKEDADGWMPFDRGFSHLDGGVRQIDQRLHAVVID